ncbi:MAG: hypothetical protein M1358_22085 [Chloroflexi bacterium]|nr:hypothetical protein [Chloroflexota bacterium]
MNVGTVQGNSTSRASSRAQGAVAGNAPVTNPSDSSALMGVGKSDFLKLLVAQLRNQDPMKPMEDREFIAQMAQLNTVEQLNDLNARLSEFLGYQSMAQASGLIGKIVQSRSASGKVEEVVVEQGKPVLIVGGRMVGLSDIEAIKDAKE